MTPNGELWFREETYSHDFSLERLKKKHRFMHEMVHAWQAQKGMFVRTRGLFSRFADYSYSLDKKDALNYYLIESDQEKGYSTIKYGENLNLSYPDDCINIKWEYGYSYAVSYGLNGKHYIHEFFINNNGQLRELRE